MKLLTRLRLRFNLLEHGWYPTILAELVSFNHLLVIHELQTLWHIYIWILTNNISQCIKLLLHLLLLRRFWLPEKLVRNIRLLLGFGHRDTGEDISLVDGELVFGPRKRIFLVLGLVEARVALVEVRMLRLQHM